MSAQPTTAERPTTECIRTLLDPRSFALIGASDNSTFSQLLFQNLTGAGFSESTFLVNPRHGTVHGVSTYSSCQSIGEDIDLAHIMVRAEAVVDALRDAAAAGAKAAIVLSSGWSESGPQGQARQDELVALAEELGVALLGPNVLGAINVTKGIPAIALSDPPVEAGGVALISQSGASCGAMKEFAAMSGVGLSHILTVGNEAMVTVGHLIDVLTDSDDVRAIAIFMESIKKPETFAAAVKRATQNGKPVVVLKAGRSELAARSAASHTGAIVGDDNVVDAIFRDLGVIRVDTIEDMLVTAGLGAFTKSLARPGIGVVSISGGACDIFADLAQSAGAEIPEFSDETVKRLTDAMPEFGYAHNPLDITGAAITQPALWTDTVKAVADDPNIGSVLVINSLPWREEGLPFYGQKFVNAIGEGASEAEVPVVYVTQTSQPLGRQTREILTEGGVRHVIPGLRLAVDAVARIARWSELRLQPRAGSRPLELPYVARRPVTEVAARKLLTAAGVPVVPSWHVSSGSDAKRAVDEAGSNVAMKVVSAEITHKSDIGGVRLNVNLESAESAYEELVSSCMQARPEAEVDGVLISPMRSAGTELLVGVTNDRDWGLLLAIGIGGLLVEVFNDVVLAPLPVDERSVSDLLSRLRGAELLDGVRGRPGADRQELASAIVGIARLAEALAAQHGESFDSLEVNPLRVDGTDVEALDALITWTEAD